MKALVTGATGFVGSNLCRKLGESENFVVALIRDIPTYDKWLLESLSKCTTVAIGDVRNIRLLKRVITRYDIDTVFHLAAQSIVRRAIKDPINTYESNVIGTVNILEACRDTDVKAILVTSTDKVYGEMPKLKSSRAETIHPYKEDSRLFASGIYESSKACADIISRSYAQIYRLPIVVTRACNIYGLGDRNPRIIPNTIRTCLSGGGPIIYKGIKYKREYIYVDDVLDAYLKLVEEIGKTEGKAYNVGSRQIASQEKIVLMILEHFPVLEPLYQAPKAYMKKEITNQLLDSSKMWNEIRWKAEISLDEGIDRTVEWWKNWSK